MKVFNSTMKVGIGGLLLAALLAQGPLMAAESEEHAEAQRRAMEVERRALEAEREALMASVEGMRQEAERAAEEARMKAERLRAETERMRVQAEAERERAGELREEQMREMQRMREDLSRTHRELRRASQEVAKAHRDLTLAEDRRLRARLVNLGDRAMLGVILGDETDEGIRIVGLSPDGPAERAGLQTGDVLVSLRGESLRADDRSPREVVYDVMSDVGDGEEIAVEVLRDGERRDFMVRPEIREPASWASFIRLPDPAVAPDAPDAPDTPEAPDAVAPAIPVAPSAPAHLERLAIPPVDMAELAAEAEALARELETYRIQLQGLDGESFSYAFDFDSEDFDFDFDEEALAEISASALGEAHIWLGSPATHGIRFTELNEGLQGYFDADRGVLVLDAPADNPLGLQAGDVVLSIGDDDVNATSDIVRALRDLDAGDAFTINIKRNKKDEALQVVMPEKRFGLLHELKITDS